MRAIWSYAIALLIIIVIAVWMGTGYIVQGGQGPGKGIRPAVSLVEKNGGPLTNLVKDVAPKSPEDPSAPNPDLTIAERNVKDAGGATKLRSVRVQTFKIGLLPLEVTLRGQTKASSVVAALAETSGTIDKVHVTKGQTVAAGDLLCSLDPSTRVAAVSQAQSSLAQAEASLAQSQLSFDTNASLRAKGLAPANSAEQFSATLAGAKAGVQAAHTGLDNAKAELARTEIRAKVGGIIQAPLANVGATLSPGQTCATIAQLDPILFVGNVPEARISLAKTGLTAEVSTISGQTAKGKVTYVSALADNATRSFPIEIQLANANGKIVDGLTAEAKVNLGTVPAHLIPQSVLTLDDAGVLGVRAVDKGVVKFFPVTIASDTREGDWVLGLPPVVDIITVGQEYVTAGQKVDASQSVGG